MEEEHLELDLQHLHLGYPDLHPELMCRRSGDRNLQGLPDRPNPVAPLLLLVPVAQDPELLALLRLPLLMDLLLLLLLA